MKVTRKFRDNIYCQDTKRDSWIRLGPNQVPGYFDAGAGMEQDFTTAVEPLGKETLATIDR